MFGFGKEKNPIIKTVISDPKNPEGSGEVVDTNKPPEWEYAGAQQAISGAPETASGAVVEKRITEGTLSPVGHAVPEGEGVGTLSEIEHLRKSGRVVTDLLRARRNRSALD